MKRITINPTDQEIDRDIKLSDSILIFHNLKSTAQFEKVLNQTIDHEKNEVVYIHVYTGDYSYTVGLKNING